MPTSAPKEDGDAALLQKSSRSWSEGAVSTPLPGLNVLICEVGITTLQPHWAVLWGQRENSGEALDGLGGRQP